MPAAVVGHSVWNAMSEVEGVYTKQPTTEPTRPNTAVKSLRYTLVACIGFCGIVPGASADDPARFWISTSDATDLTSVEPVVPTIQGIDGSIQTIYIWARPGKSASGVTTLEDFSLDLVTISADPVGSFQRDRIVVYNPSRFKSVVDSGRGQNFPANPDEDDSKHGINACVNGACGIRGIEGYSIVLPSDGTQFTGIGQPCNVDSYCAPAGPAWLVASIGFKILKSSGTTEYHLQIGGVGMQYLDTNLPVTAPEEAVSIIFGTDGPEYTYTYNTANCSAALCADTQMTKTGDSADLIVQAFPSPPGDFGRDGLVGPEDYAMWKQTFGQSVTTPGDGADGNINGVVDAGDYTIWRDRRNVLPGDFSRDGKVDHADYAMWKVSFGQSVTAGTGADANGNGVVDAGDFTVWRDHRTLPPGGDYNHNGIVDAADYTVWRDTFGSTSDLSADGDGSRVVDAADYDVWSYNFGTIIGSGSASRGSSDVPEPSTIAMTLVALGFVLCRPGARPVSPEVRACL
jgi:hypothetical protein